VSAIAHQNQRVRRAISSATSTPAHASGSVRSRPTEIGRQAGTAKITAYNIGRAESAHRYRAATTATTTAAPFTSTSASAVLMPGMPAKMCAVSAVAMRC
jgi:hypothetical protein